MERLVGHIVSIVILSLNSSLYMKLMQTIIYCKLRINKDGKVRRSKWDVQPLSPEQQIYAAIDVYVSFIFFTGGFI